MHYHCPGYGVFNFIKPKYKCSDRTIWKYDQEDYENLRRNHVFDWNSISDNNVDKDADNFTEVLSNDAKLYIPNKKVIINPHEPPWITCNIKIKRKIDRGKDFIEKQDSQARKNIGQDFGHLEMK